MFLNKLTKTFRRSLSLKKRYSTSSTLNWEITKQPELDTEYFCDVNNVQEIENNIKSRKRIGNTKLTHFLTNKLKETDVNDESYKAIQSQFVEELLKMPNKTHPDVESLQEPKIVKYLNDKPSFEQKPLEFQEIAKRLNLVRNEHLGNLCGSKSYYILGEMAELESALINYVTGRLLSNGFNLITVPDILPQHVIESCGMTTKGDRTQVYFLDAEKHGEGLCLSGTSEMALAGYFMNKTLKEEELPIKLAAISRCFRAETSSIAEERGIYRVHEFTKVEMFVVSTPETSDSELKKILEIQEKNFESLGIHCQVLDMPPYELGAPAYRKYDIEAWLPGRKMFGEISSCSNCTDYQSRRLGTKYISSKGQEFYVHTLNGTACAIPRMLIALVETYQQKKGIVNIPSVLQKYMNNKTSIGRQKDIPELRLIKNKK